MTPALLLFAAAAVLDPAATIVDAFHTHRVVALGDNHGNLQGHAMRVALVRDPRFAGAVNDIVVEFGTARYQELMDRYIAGEAVPREQLRHVWQDTTQVEYEWDLPIYEEFFRAVREVNAALPRERRLRVLLGDPPVDWDRIRTVADLHAQMGDRDAHAAAVIRREVLDKGRRALVIYGDQHLSRKNRGGIVALLEKSTPVFSIHTESRVDLHLPTLGIVPLRGAGPGIEDEFDAVAYLGPPATMRLAQLSQELCADPTYMTMRERRLSLLPPPPGAPFIPAEKLRDDCEARDDGVEIADRNPSLTAAITQVLRDAARGEVDATRFAPESRNPLTAFIRQMGPRMIAPMGTIESMTLLLDVDRGGRRLRRYRAMYSTGRKVVWTIGLTAAGEIRSLDPRPE